MDEIVAMKGEVYLGCWSDVVVSSSGASDAWIKLYLSDSSMLDNIRPHDARGKAKQGGKRYALVMVEIGDDEKPVVQNKPKGHMTHLSNVAGMICEQHADEFGKWFKERLPAHYKECRDMFGAQWKEMQPKVKCKHLICHACSISSRAELDTKEDSASEFRVLISEPFQRYLDS